MDDKPKNMPKDTLQQRNKRSVARCLDSAGSDPAVAAFLRDLLASANSAGVSLLLDDSDKVPYLGSSIMVNGYFSDDDATLACAVGGPTKRWIHVLLHESSHMDQCLESCPEWLQNKGLEGVDRWLAGEDVDPATLDEEVRTSIAVEVDCERRTLAKVLRWGLANYADPKTYARMSNAYILFYHWMRARRRWYDIGREPYRNPAIVGAMPDSLDIDYSRLGPRLMRVFDDNM